MHKYLELDLVWNQTQLGFVFEKTENRESKKCEKPKLRTKAKALSNWIGIEGSIKLNENKL